ncbi:DegT/DnrJ/EryC1/StrS family aminotransferase [Rhodospirillaceae bacterium KN72]|uniref:DegT/DnrJ/EryC1/StrS family aminotransferase n=1 Tax=Pacificispira spongiicola TaxID=2729598 RepID=A0A7Y0E1Q1_9PROT|nr:DegT/DnrJ/EryC1/StrS family aminotransferase [Pacificispira spongiicola]NMM45599.1 DegT/DnrJ/EryC1/StrS family aminotransferase [Pacificispira spongiicola]
MAIEASSPAPLAFVDLQAQYASYKDEIDAAIHRVLDHGKFIMGPEVGELESALADFSGAKHVVGCSSGTDALLMILMAEGIGAGDAVFVPSFTFTATAEVLLLLGAQPVFVDVDPDDFNLCLEDLERRIDAVKASGVYTPRGILAVDLFGLPVDYAGLQALADMHGLKVWGDAAQSFGGSIGDRKVGALARATATSFFPAKPFGCYGDGGAVFTDDDVMADVMRSIRAHGKGGDKYDIIRVGLNARLDTIQAAILLAKLPHFAGEVDRREAVAQKYDALLSGKVRTPVRRQGRSSAWAQYTIKVPADRRDAISAALKQSGVPSAVYYPLPMHLQTAYRAMGDGKGSLPVSEALSGEVLSLPMHPFLTDDQIAQVAEALIGAV